MLKVAVADDESRVCQLTQICDRTALFSNGRITKILEHEAMGAPPETYEQSKFGCIPFSAPLAGSGGMRPTGIATPRLYSSFSI